MGVFHNCPRSKEAVLCSISHAWESREHPDPCGFQLGQVVSHTSLFALAFAADIWLFFDYTSLFQFKRQTDSEENSFRLSMGNMHALYSHESTMTFRIENLTPEHLWQEALKDTAAVTIFHMDSGKVKPVPLTELVRNMVPYRDRGWCRAEINWSCTRGASLQNQQIDVQAEESEDWQRDKYGHILPQLRGKIPTAPEAFAADMRNAAFTHRSDAECVIELQKKIFLEKVTVCEDLALEGLPLEEMQALLLSLPYFKALRSVSLIDFKCGKEEAEAIAKAVEIAIGIWCLTDELLARVAKNV